MALALGILHIPSWTWHCNCIACISRFRSSKFTASKSPGALNRTLAADAGSPLIRQIISNIYIICHYLTNSTKPCGSNWHMTHLLWERSSEGMQFASPQRLEVWPATRSSLVQGVAHPCYVYFPHLDPCDSMCLTGRYWKQFDLGNWHMLHMLLCFSLECLGGCLCLLASFGIFWLKRMCWSLHFGNPAECQVQYNMVIGQPRVLALAALLLRQGDGCAMVCHNLHRTTQSLHYSDGGDGDVVIDVVVVAACSRVDSNPLARVAIDKSSG